MIPPAPCPLDFRTPDRRTTGKVVPPRGFRTSRILAHREWIGQIGPVGLVVSPTVLVRQGVFVDRQRSVEVQARLTVMAGEEGDQPVDPIRFFTEILDWPVGILADLATGYSTLQL